MMFKLLIAMFISLVAFSNQAEAIPHRLLDVDQVNMEISKFGCNRDPIIPELECGDWRGRVALNADLRIIEYMYWKNEIHGEGDESAFKTMGWHFELGMNISKYVDLFYEHHSRHTLDQSVAYSTSYDKSFTSHKFPLEDSYGIRFIFYTNTSKRQTVSDRLYP